MEPLPIKDIHLPAPIGWWPPAPGWWLALLVLMGLCYAGVWWRRRMKIPNVRRIALHELEALMAEEQLGPQQKAQQLSILLRRVALTTSEREKVAGLQGREWLLWLDGLLADGRFVEGPGQALADLPYRPQGPEQDQLDALFALARDWLQRIPTRS